MPNLILVLHEREFFFTNDISKNMKRIMKKQLL